MDTRKYTHNKLNPDDLPSPVQLTKFSRRNLSKWFRVLGYETGAEIGVAEGRHSKQMLDLNPGLHLLCVDTWAKYRGNPRGGPQTQHDRNFAIAKRILTPFNTEIVQAFSIDAVRDIPLESLDFVYIDGNHSFDWVMQDIIEWGKRVRRGGIISGHDFYKFRAAGVIDAVYAYTKVHGVKEWFITNEDWQGRHKECSWFWVK